MFDSRYTLPILSKALTASPVQIKVFKLGRGWESFVPVYFPRNSIGGNGRDFCRPPSGNDEDSSWNNISLRVYSAAESLAILRTQSPTR